MTTQLQTTLRALTVIATVLTGTQAIALQGGDGGCVQGPPRPFAQSEEAAPIPGDDDIEIACLFCCNNSCNGGGSQA